MAVPLLDTTSFAEGACLGVPACTAHNALFWSGPISDMTVLVQGGAGAVAGYAIQLAALSGARVIATVSSEKKMAVASQLGADLVIAYSVQSVMEAVLEVTNGLGVDRIVEVDFGSNVALDAQILRSKGAIGHLFFFWIPAFRF